MKVRFGLVLLLLQATVAFCQEKFLPEIKKGITLTYQVSAQGQLFPVLMKIDSIGPEYSRFNWSMSDGTSGYVINTKPSLENAIRGYWGNLNNGEDQTMPQDQTIIVASKALWNAIQKDKKFTLDDQQFIVKDQPADAIFKLNSKPVNVVYAETANAGVRVWFLNNQAAPIMLKIEGNPAGVDIFLQSID
jgi:hypothetical protein